MDDSDPGIHSLWGAIYLLQRKYDQAIAEAERAVALGPNEADFHALLAMILHHAGKFKEAVALVRKAMRLHPYYPDYYLDLLGGAYLQMGEYEKAVEVLKMSVFQEPHRIEGHLFLAISYIRLGRKEKTRSEVAEILRLFPGYSLEMFRKRVWDMDPAMVESHIEALREAGLK